MSITELIEKIKNNPECKVYDPKGVPVLGDGFELPHDLKVFYEKCGGISLFTHKSYGFNIVEPDEFIISNPIIVGELCEYDISSNWFIMCKDSECNYITIDLNPKRLGRCYDSFWDRHGVVGECRIIANNFNELVEQLYNSQGNTLYWLEDDFQYLGDAYDE